MLRKRLQVNISIFVLIAASSFTLAQPVQADFTSIPVVAVSANPETTNWYPDKYKPILYRLISTNSETGYINSVTSGFYTQSNILLAGYSSWTGVYLDIGPFPVYYFSEYDYLPKEVVDDARALGEYAVLYKSIFEGTSTSGDPFSAEVSILVLLPPAPFSKASPINDSLLQPTNTTLNWNSSLGVYNSEYCIDTIKNSHCDSKWIGTYEFSKALSRLTPNTTYYWQVRALNYLGGITYADDGNWWSFKTKIIYPILPAPYIHSSKNNFPTNLSTPTLIWGKVLRAHSYEIVIALDGDFSQVIKNEIVNIPSFLISPALSDGKYYWHVRTLNGDLQPGKFSKTQSFTIDTTGPTTPILSSPIDNTFSKRTPTFRWLSVPTAVIYEFQYDDNPDFSSPKYAVTTRSNFRRPPAMGIGTYYWRIRAKDTAGNWSNWSIPFIITITAP
jgi:hypothetical protein